MGFKVGDQVEICSEEEGLLGSYYAAKIIGQLGNKKKKKTEYVVQYETLLKEDESGPLVEVVPDSEVRPKPPEETPAEFMSFDEVDAYDKDGWWAGKVIGKDGCERFLVYFDNWEDEVAYPSSKLRVHHDWCNGKWLSSKHRASKS